MVEGANEMSFSKGQKYIFLIVLFVGGSIFFLIQRNWLIINFSPRLLENRSIKRIIKNKINLSQKVKLYYWHDDKFIFEEKDFVKRSNKSDSLRNLVNNWLLFLHLERVISKKVVLDSVCLDQTEQQAFFSFDQIPYDTNWSIFKKWHFIESLFKTIKDAQININSIIFLVNHEKMHDNHLDFSQPWPIEGFLV